MNYCDDVLKRNNVTVLGEGNTTLLLAHGFGCDQNVWRFLFPYVKDDYKVILFDYVGSGKSDISQFKPQKYNTLEGYAEDIIDICEALSLNNVTLIGHSVSSIIGLLASIKKPEHFAKLVMVCPSPCFLNYPPDYFGGFDEADLHELLSLMDKNYIGWAEYLAPLVMGVNNSETLIGELSGSFCSTDPVIAKSFAKATFFSDHRANLHHAKHPTLIFQSENDALAAKSIGEYIHNEIPCSSLEVIEAEGHCLHMTHPELISSLLIKYINEK
ncbi:sigma factor SigB regulation protein RsbQ [Oceanisphaera arctica]|uniref:Sigma factor SigB regulation protein RsbQ n=2 Tax=Oceanisphaera arctica TaxID=641510 RepID=A0A2P5TPR2_9GAMM|nr:sigma factor SigB regulation protein RsbQ [Oceanisphaera arctica]GHA18922.1 sigma factor SigB regulation protein RsbQ [Oceanisphaera arctica]